MGSIVSARTALMQALRQGPGYGLDLAAGLRRRAGHRVATGSLYPALEALRRDGLVRSWNVVPGGRKGGRSRTYYELTYAGRLEADRQARALQALVAHAAPGSRGPSSATLRQRLRRVSDLIAFTEDARRARMRRP